MQAIARGGERGGNFASPLATVRLAC